MAVPGIDVWPTRGITFAAFDAARLGVWSDPTNGGVLPHTPYEALVQSGAAAVLDGPMFGICGGQDLPSGNAGAYAASSCDTVRFRQYDGSRGTSFSGTADPGEGLTIAIVNGQAVALDGAQMPDGATVAVQTYPTLVRNELMVASNVPNGNGTAEWRAGVGILSDGRVVFGAGAATMEGLANAFIAAGAVNAGYTDGGGSAALWLADGSWYGASEQRRVATWLVVGPPVSGLAKLVPQTTLGRLAVAGLVVSVGAFGWLLYDQYGRGSR